MSVPGGPGQMNNLTTLIKRLEAATSRLEDIASSSASPEAQNGSSGAITTGAAGGMHQSSSAPELPATAETASKARDTASHAPMPAQITDMDALLEEHSQGFVGRAKDLGDKVLEDQALAVAKAFGDQRWFLLVSTRAKKPDMTSPEAAALIQDLQGDMSAVGDARDANRGSQYKDCLNMVGEGIGALQWLVMEGKPAEFVGEVVGGAQMYGNRVLSANKGKEEGQSPALVKFVQAYYGLLKALQAYVKKHYPSGVTWNNNGVEASQAWKESAPSGSSDSSDANTPTANGTPAAGGAPPPPPPPMPNFDNAGGPPPPPPPPGAAPQNKAQGGDMGAVFSELNRGSDVTKGLKKVDKSQMTHKNPSLRAQGDSTPSSSQPSRSTSRGPDTKPKPSALRQNSSASASPPKKQPKKELDGNKWLIENFDSPSQPLTIEVEITQSILISRCKNTTLILKGKANAISIDNSPRLQLLIDNLVSSVDVIKSPNFAIQVTGSLPTVLLDQVDGAQIYLGKESLGCEVFTSKCSSVNVVLPPEDEEKGDSKECALPEQMRTVIKGGKLVSEIVEHAG